MSSPSDRAALRARQGAGARYDAPEAPVFELVQARRGTSYFSRLLNDLQDDVLASPSLISGINRADLIAAVAYHARGLTRLLDEEVEHASDTARLAEIQLGACLPPRALRGLFQHTSIHLDVTWRDLPGSAWEEDVTRHDGSRLSRRATAQLRAEVIWWAAIALGGGGRAQDIPFQAPDPAEMRLELGLHEP